MLSRSPTSSVFNYPTRVAFRDSAEGSALCYLKKAKVWTRLPVNNISKSTSTSRKPHVVVVDCGKKEACFNLANPYVAASSFHFDGAATAWRPLCCRDGAPDDAHESIKNAGSTPGP